MNLTVRGWLAVWAVLALGGMAWGQGVRTSITLEEMEGLLRSWGYSYERREAAGAEYFRLRLEGLHALLFLFDCQDGQCRSLQLYAGFSMRRKPSLERINQWNQEKRFSRAYIDKDGDPVLEADLWIGEGVTEATIQDFLDTFRISLRAFAVWIGFL